MTAFHESGLDFIDEHEVIEMTRMMTMTDKDDPISKDDFKRFCLEK
jgi:hypothetical protein